MKLSLASSLLACLCASTSAFNVAAPLAFSPSSTTSLNMGSRNQQKIASRAKWAEARGYGVESADDESSSGVMTNEDGLEYVKLTNANGSTSDVYLYGGVVTSLIVDGQEYIAVRPDAKMDGSKPISGGLSHCWPQFGPGEIQQHGFARNVDWSIASQSPTSVDLELKPSDYTKEMWDKSFACTFKVSLNEDDTLTTVMNVENEGDEAFDFQSALHSYFTVSGIDNLEIAGSFKGKEFLNKMVGDEGEMQTEERELITISEEYDRVYKGVNDPVLKDKGTGKTLSVLNTAGYEDTVLWNPYGNEGMGFNNFVCVESVKFDPVSLPGGESWVGEMTLKPAAMEE